MSGVYVWGVERFVDRPDAVVRIQNLARIPNPDAGTMLGRQMQDVSNHKEAKLC